MSKIKFTAAQAKRLIERHMIDLNRKPNEPEKPGTGNLQLANICSVAVEVKRTDMTPREIFNALKYAVQVA